MIDRQYTTNAKDYITISILLTLKGTKVNRYTFIQILQYWNHTIKKYDNSNSSKQCIFKLLSLSFLCEHKRKMTEQNAAPQNHIQQNKLSGTLD